jgi:hypothetical protein
VAENAGVDITGPLNTFNGCGIDIVILAFKGDRIE